MIIGRLLYGIKQIRTQIRTANQLKVNNGKRSKHISSIYETN